MMALPSGALTSLTGGIGTHVPERTDTDRSKSLERIRSRAHRLQHDSTDIFIWARLTGDEALQAAAAQIGRARRELYQRSNALLLADETADEGRN